MLRDLANFLSVLSLLLAMAVCGLWWRHPKPANDPDRVRLRGRMAVAARTAQTRPALAIAESEAAFAHVITPSLVEFTWGGKQWAIERRISGFSLTDRPQWERDRAAAALAVDQAADQFVVAMRRAHDARDAVDASHTASASEEHQRLQRELDDAEGAKAQLGIRYNQSGMAYERVPLRVNATAGGAVVSVTYPSVVAATLVIPTVWLIAAGMRFLRRCSRRGRQRCPDCGYDLRASPERCPECGAVRTDGTLHTA